MECSSQQEGEDQPSIFREQGRFWGAKLAWVRRRYGLQQQFAYGNLNFKPSAPHCTLYSPEHCQGLLLGSEPVVSPDYCLAWFKNLKKKREKKGGGRQKGSTGLRGLLCMQLSLGLVPRIAWSPQYPGGLAWVTPKTADSATGFELPPQLTKSYWDREEKLLVF